MTSIHWSHPLRVARPLGLLSRTRIQFQPTQLHQISLQRHGHRSGARSFHIAPTAVAVMQATQGTLLSIHAATHIPWFLMIPLIAAGINLVFRQPSHIYTHKILQRRSRLGLVLRAWSWRIQRDVVREGIPPKQQKKEVVKRFQRTTKRIYRSLGLQEWKMYSGVLAVPFWLVGIDSVRRLCGGPMGILGNLLTRTDSDKAITSGTQGSTEAAASSTDISITAASQISAVDPSAASTVVEHARHLPDPSIALEGCLWFPDLSVADPYHILPLALSVTIVATMLPKTSAGRRQLFGLKSADDETSELTPTAQRQLRLRRGLMFLGASIGFVTMDMPAALHLYWLSSSAMQWSMSKALSHFMPIKENTVEMCKGAEANIIRPLRDEETMTEMAKPQKKIKK
ncbi:hypothetical protein F4819DRAFT_303996 [Hypoxylon fuscum]|nr:hypothetical protein F4819DRAFT_303996 [Hypoxylon fuscum]